MSIDNTWKLNTATLNQLLTIVDDGPETFQSFIHRCHDTAADVPNLYLPYTDLRNYKATFIKPFNLDSQEKDGFRSLSWFEDREITVTILASWNKGEWMLILSPSGKLELVTNPTTSN